jgi:molybdopterin converting factor small subunit
MSPEEPVVVVRCFAAARQAFGQGRLELRAGTVGAVLDELNTRAGPAFAAVAATCRLWVNGEPATTRTVLKTGDEVALLPPVSGGC